MQVNLWKKNRKTSLIIPACSYFALRWNFHYVLFCYLKLASACMFAFLASFLCHVLSQIYSKQTYR